LFFYFLPEKPIQQVVGSDISGRFSKVALLDLLCYNIIVGFSYSKFLRFVVGKMSVE